MIFVLGRLSSGVVSFDVESVRGGGINRFTNDSFCFSMNRSYSFIYDFKKKKNSKFESRK